MSRRSPLPQILPFLIGFALISGAGAAPAPAGPARLVENTGQHPEPVRYTAALAGARAWLTGDAIWLTFAERADGQLAGVHLRLDFGGGLAWEPLGPAGLDLCLVSGTSSGAQTLRPRTWPGVRAALPGGAVLSVTGDGIGITGGPGAAAALTLAGGVVELERVGSASAIRVGGRTLPLRWEVPLAVNGQEFGDRGGRIPQAAHLEAGPQIHFSTYIGGENWDEAEAIGRDASGNIYVAGQSLSMFFPTAPGPFLNPLHNVEAFVARLNWLGTVLDYICVVRADIEDWGTAMTVDAAGNAFLFGYTDSTANFPFTAGAYDVTPNGAFDLFLMKFDPAGELVFSTLIGGGDDEFAGGVALRPDGTIVLAGSTGSDGSSSDAFPTTSNAYSTIHHGGRDIFVAVMNAAGSDLLYSTFVGGSQNEHAEALALFGSAVVIGGWSGSPDFDNPDGGFDTTLAGNFDGLVFSLTPGEAGLDFWTFLGGLDDGVTSDRVLAIDLDGSGNVFVAGSTYAADFPATPGAFDESFDGSCLCSDGFVAKLAGSGSDLVWATFLGAGGDDVVEALVLDPDGDLVLAGATSSAGFPVSAGAHDDALDGDTDAFIARLAASGSALPYATYLGGAVDESALGVAVTDGGWLLAAGWSNSADFPTTPGVYDPEHNFDKDAFVTVLIPPGAAPLQRVWLPVVLRDSAAP